MISSFKRLVSWMVLHTAPKFSQFFLIFFDTSDIIDHEVIIKIYVSKAFNTACRALTVDVLSGYASRDYACGLKHKDVIEWTCAPLSSMSAYFHAMRTCHANLRCFDWDGEVHHLAKGKRGGQHGDPLEVLMFNLMFNLTTLHLWGRTLAKYPQARATRRPGRVRMLTMDR
jgi:hypothetical protein